MGDGRNRRMRTAATAANRTRIPYSLRMKVLAPSLIRADTSIILTFSTDCFFTHRYR